MSRLSDQREKQGESIPADPLPDTKVEGDSSDTEIFDDNDAPPGVDPKGAKRDG
jgi:hypothetical protein